MIDEKVPGCQLIIDKKRCNGNEYVKSLYFPDSKELLIKCNRHPNYGDLMIVTLPEIIEQNLETGSSNHDFQFLLDNIPDLKSLWDEVASTLEPMFEEGEEVVFYSGHRSPFHTLSRRKAPTMFIAGQIEGWKKVCDRVTGENKLICSREFICVEHGFVEDNRITTTEDYFSKSSSIETWELGNEVMASIKKQFKKAGKVGATIYYRGSVYRI